MNYISKVFSPRVNLTRVDSEEITKLIPPTNFKNLIMEQNTVNQAVNQALPSGVRSRRKTDTNGSKTL